MSEFKKIYYWAPFINKVATIKAVYNSVNSLNRYSPKKYRAKIIDSFGEWEHNNYFNQNKEFFFSLTKISFLNRFSSFGFLKSRIKYLIIFLLCFFPLKNFIKKIKPEFFIIHLVTSLPLFLNLIYKFETKFILRISGKPKLNFIRFFFWKISLKKVYKITFPTQETLDYFKSLKIADQTKFELLYDPILNIKEICKKKNEHNDDNILKNNEFYLAIGRLTEQKNFNFLVECFSEILKNRDVKLVIIGTGEDKNYLEKLIDKYNLKNNVYLVGFKDNVFKYLVKSRAFILSSLWEDPGFVIVEAMFSNTLVISSDCSSGPKEILNSNRGILYKNNDKKDFIKKFNFLLNLEEKQKLKKRILAKKFVKKFTLLNHHNKLIQLFN